ncbi:hypothetical protein BD413DRAFT_244561 [Trametes elegans]|nr:hypothetical protein BD413DRAFT_244561 [Trametes elegans]
MRGRDPTLPLCPCANTSLWDSLVSSGNTRAAHALPELRRCIPEWPMTRARVSASCARRGGVYRAVRCIRLSSSSFFCASATRVVCCGRAVAGAPPSSLCSCVVFSLFAIYGTLLRSLTVHHTLILATCQLIMQIFPLISTILLLFAASISAAPLDVESRALSGAEARSPSLPASECSVVPPAAHTYVRRARAHP